MVAAAQVGEGGECGGPGAQPQDAGQTTNPARGVGLLVPALADQRVAAGVRNRPTDGGPADRHQPGNDREGLLPLHPVGDEGKA